MLRDKAQLCCWRRPYRTVTSLIKQHSQALQVRWRKVGSFGEEMKRSIRESYPTGIERRLRQTLGRKIFEYERSKVVRIQGFLLRGLL